MINWKQYSESWYAGYAFQGAVVLGIAPILLPLVVGNASGAALAGVVVAALYMGQLTAPFLGSLTDKFSLHRLVYMAGYVLLALGLALFPLDLGIWFWMLLAFVQGIGSAASNTVAAMFIVETRPKPEWDSRIGWLQTFYGLGQAIGLGLAALLQSSPQTGLLIAAALMLPGAFFGRKGLPRPNEHKKPQHLPKFRHHLHLQPRMAMSFVTHYERLLPGELLKFVRFWENAFGLYIASWFFTMLGTWLIYNLYPLLMKSAYGIQPGPSSALYAVAAVVGVFCYAPSGTLGKKIGDGAVVMIGTLMTLVSVAGMAFFAYVPTTYGAWAAALLFGVTPVAWSPLIVAGTAYAAQLATINEGAALGIFNASTAVASVLAAFGAGLLAEFLGYDAVPLLGAFFVLLGAVLLVLTMRRAKTKA